MPIVIENPSAQSIFAIVRMLPVEEQKRLRELLDAEPATALDESSKDESTDWCDEDLDDLDRYTAQLIDERYGPEEGNYD